MAKKKIILKAPPEKEMAEKYQKDLNEQQFQAVSHRNGPALVIAGAGSGKTRMLTYRVAYLIEQGANPHQIVLVTFTKKAAEEMSSRVNNLIGNQAKGLYAGTFHHLANQFLRKYANVLGYARNFTIMDRSDSHALMKIILNANKDTLSSSNQNQPNQMIRFPKPSQLVDMYSKAINHQQTYKEIITENYPGYFEIGSQIEELLHIYQQQKRKHNQMDFDDLLINFEKILTHAKIGPVITQQIQHVLVDEYQDINLIQAKIVYALAKQAQSVTIVGDDAQSIYAFRGADFSQMLDFPKKYPNCTEYKLEINYRSTPEILALANASIAHNQHQFKKTLQAVRSAAELPMFIPCDNLEQEAAIISQQILAFRDEGIPFHEQAVLFRSRHHALELERNLVQNDIPYDMRAGVRFFEQAHIKDLLALLAIIVNPLDQIQWIRFLNLLPGISDGSSQKIIHLLEQAKNPVEKFCQSNLKELFRGKRIRSNGMEQMIKLQTIYRNLITEPSSYQLLPEDQLPPIPKIIESFIGFASPLLKNKYSKNWEERVQDLTELQNFAAKYNSLNEFLADILTQYNIRGEGIKEDQDHEPERPLILSTIHQAKGLEWKVVYIISLLEGRLPHVRAIGNPNEIEEERRLFYVASTRAKDYLIMTYPIFVWRHSYDDIVGRSRFIDEIAELKVFDEYEIEIE